MLCWLHQAIKTTHQMFYFETYKRPIEQISNQSIPTKGLSYSSNKLSGINRPTSKGSKIKTKSG